MPAFNESPARQLHRRSYENSHFSPIAIVGLILASLVLLTVVISFLVRFVRKRNVAKRESTIGAAFLDVKGLVPEDGFDSGHSEKASPPQFSRSKMTASILLPSRAYTRSSPSTPESYPADFAFSEMATARPCGPFGFALDARANRASTMSTNSTGSGIRFSMASLLSIATTSSYRASMMTPPVGSGTDTRKVHQPFTNPSLPDELFVAIPGERLTIFHSYDDGWCAVGRKNALGFGAFSKGSGSHPDIQVGYVPAWCFMRPVKGVRVERPVRGSSLGTSGTKQSMEDQEHVPSSRFSHF